MHFGGSGCNNKNSFFETLRAYSLQQLQIVGQSFKNASEGLQETLGGNSCRNVFHQKKNFQQNSKIAWGEKNKQHVHKLKNMCKKGNSQNWKRQGSPLFPRYVLALTRHFSWLKSEQIHRQRWPSQVFRHGPGGGVRGDNGVNRGQKRGGEFRTDPKRHTGAKPTRQPSNGFVAAACHARHSNSAIKETFQRFSTAQWRDTIGWRGGGGRLFAATG